MVLKNQIVKFLYCGKLEVASGGKVESSVTTSEGATNSHEEVYRMLLLSDQMNVPSCIAGCAIALGAFDYTFEEVIHYLEIIPDMLFHAGGTQPFCRALQRVLESRFPSFDGLIIFKPSEDMQGEDSDRWGTTILCDAFQRLPEKGLELLLKSDQIKAKSENIVYRVVELWLDSKGMEEAEKKEVFDRLLEWMSFVAMSPDILSWYVMRRGSLVLESPSRLLRLCSVFAMHSSSEGPSTFGQYLERRPGTRWGNPADFELTEAVWDIKLEDVRGMHDSLDCPMPFLIDGFVVFLILRKQHVGGCNHPRLALYLQDSALDFPLEGFEEYSITHATARRIIWKLDMKLGNGETKVVSHIQKDVGIQVGALEFFSFGERSGKTWDEFVVDNGCFFQDGTFRVIVQLQLAQSVGPC